MIRQRCQRCDRAFNPDSTYHSEGDDPIDVSIYIGEWSRTYVLCGGCATDLQRQLALMMTGIPLRSPLSGVVTSLESGWNSPKKTQPDVPKFVLLKMGNGAIKVGYRSEGAWYSCEGWPSESYAIYPQAAVVGWQILPGGSDD